MKKSLLIECFPASAGICILASPGQMTSDNFFDKNRRVSTASLAIIS